MLLEFVLVGIGVVVLALAAVVALVECDGEIVYDQKVRTAPEDRVLRRIDRLPPKVWTQLQTDLHRGQIERRKRLRVRSVYALDVPQQLLDRFVNDDPDIRQLYHGTPSLDAVKGIVRDGFRLPSKLQNNMFGPGVYFAQVPQKSFDYTNSKGYVLICAVALGRPKTVSRPKWIDPDRKPLSKRSWLVFREPCDTVHAPAGRATLSDEHIIFHPERAVPLFLVTLTQC